MKTIFRRFRGSVRRQSQHGVALVLVMIFLGIMLLLGLATTMTSITEVNANRNVRLATEAFNTADAGVSHAFELVRFMRGDFTNLLRGNLVDLTTMKNGDEFALGEAIIYNADGSIRERSGVGNNTNFRTDRVTPIPRVACADGVGRALVQLDPTHYYELIPYDDAADAEAYIFPSNLETDGVASVDTNVRIVIRSIGYVLQQPLNANTDFAAISSNVIASSTVDIVVGLVPYPAVISNDDLVVQNSIGILGALGSVHANDDLVLGSGNYTIAQSATFSNDTADSPPGGANDTTDHPNVTGFNGSQSALFIPDLNPIDYAEQCTDIYIHQRAETGLRTALIDKLALNGGNIVAAFAAANGGSGWDPLEVGAGFFITQTGWPTPVYTVRDRSTVNNWSNLYDGVGVGLSNQGGSAGRADIDDVPDANVTPRRSIFALLPHHGDSRFSLNGNLNGRISYITNANVHINGNVVIRPSLQITTPNVPPWDRIDLLFIAGMDMTSSGNGANTDLIEGVMYAHEQMGLAGSGNLSGQAIAYEWALLFSGNTLTSPHSSRHFTGSPIAAGASAVTGNFEVTFNIARGYLGNFALSSWRQMRDFHPIDDPRP